MPAADQPEVPKSPSKASCAAPVEDVARHGAEDEVPDDPDSEDEPPDDDLSDDGWLETLELRLKLSDTTIFDQEPRCTGISCRALRHNAVFTSRPRRRSQRAGS